MIRKIIISCILLTSGACQVQEKKIEYADFIKKAELLYNAKDFKNSAMAYSDAFKSNDWKGNTNDRYNAACCWALAGFPDSAFFNLELIAKPGDYQNYKCLMSDDDLKSLHHNERWKPLTDLVRRNKEKAEGKLNKPLASKLDSIYENDQVLRRQISRIEQEYGRNSEEISQLWEQANVNDSLNLIKVKAILDQYGWLGADVVGDQGNSTLFLVIQHADLKTQEKYLPIMRDAVKNGDASTKDLALLEDRIEIRNGRKQIYGSQIGMDKKNNTYYVEALLDPDNVDKRRASVGLEPLADYVKFWNMTWDVELYKKDLPRLESIQEKY